ncbi:FUSC family protein [Rhodopseudomonas boonkerdii]|nr:FUSC family protein [Rhodopseudomonas boonkerdii]
MFKLRSSRLLTLVLSELSHAGAVAPALGAIRQWLAKTQQFGAAALRLLLAFDVFQSRWLYVFRVALAAAIALGLAYVLQLETPYSAATTVFLSASPVQGVTLSKGMWRVAGTIFGASITVVLFAMFAQMPALFILGFALWLGICVGVSTLLRHFRAYGAVVAGYTIGLVAYGAIEQPEQIFEHAVGRVSAVALGVISLGVVTALLSPRAMSAKLRARLFDLAVGTGRLAAESLEAEKQPASRHQALIADLYGLDDLLEFAATESADVGLRAGDVRHAMAALFATVASSARLPRGDDPSSAAACALASAALQDSAAMLDTGDGAARACDVIARARRELSGLPDAAAVIAIDRVDEILEDYQDALAALARFVGSGAPGRRVAFRFHLDGAGAWENGARAAIAIVLAGALWVATAWNGAFLMILLIAPFCGLLAMTGNPVAGAIEFTKGIVAALAAGFICSFAILPHMSGFPLLIAAMLPFWIAGLVATTIPRTAPAGTAYLLTFMTMVGPTNPMVFDVANYLNSSAAFILSGVFTVLSFKVLFPRNGAKQAGRISAALRDDALALLRGAPRSHRLAWQHRQHQRLVLAAVQLKGDSTGLPKIIGDGLAAIHLGRAIFRIRQALSGDALPPSCRDAAGQGLAALKASRGDPARMAREARRAAERLQRAKDAAYASRLLASSFDDIAALLAEHAAFFHRDRKRHAE